MKLFMMFVLSFLLTACTVTHYSRSGEEIDISNYSLGMDRQGIDIQFESGERKADVKVGESNSSNGLDRAISLLDSARNLRP